MARYERRRMSAPIDSIAARDPRCSNIARMWLLVRADRDQRRLPDAGGGGRLADLRTDRQRLRPRPRRSRAVLSGGGAGSADRPHRRPLRPPCRGRHLPDHQGAGGGSLRNRHARRFSQPRRDAGDPVRQRHRARVRDADHAHAGAGIVPPALLPRAIAASSTASQTAIICGPAIGGLLYLFGASTCT